MIAKILKYVLLILLVLIVLAVLTAAPFIIKARNEGNSLYAKYDSYTQETLAKKKMAFLCCHPQPWRVVSKGR